MYHKFGLATTSGYHTVKMFFMKLILLLSLMVTSCSQRPQGPSNCGGVDLSNGFSNLEIILSCAGWLDFVINNVSEIEFVNVSSLPSSSPGIVLAQAFCGACEIRIAVLEGNLPGAVTRRSDLDIARLIVHEAAHLADNCENGEEPALEAERAFLEAYNNGDCR
ncbi:hypothetical protein IIA28_19955 [candidate division KSB1 bacterium]|nr:hypothetical protein [candidate division KSB1 bacterium]